MIGATGALVDADFFVHAEWQIFPEGMAVSGINSSIPRPKHRFNTKNARFCRRFTSASTLARFMFRVWVDMRNILVIDDSSDMRLMIATTLVYSGYSVWQAKDGREGIQMVIAEKPDLIICDVKMPGLDGYLTLEAIRKCPGTAAIPLILMTGSMGRNDFRRGMASGADDYLMKPFTTAELNAAVRSRFARQTDLQTDIIQRVEKRHFEDFRQLSKLMAAPVKGARRVVHPEPESDSFHQDIATALTQFNQPVYCLD
jgi:CheY-like chemotaxis protein